jgi:hypothetical protein
MSSIVVSVDTSGSCTLVAPAVAGGSVLTLPATSGTVLTSATGQTLTSPVINGMGSSILTSGTAQATTSGTSIDFTGIPSWAKRITVMFNGVSTNGTSNLQIQIGAGSVTTSGYASSSSTQGVSTAGVNSTAGFVSYNNVASNVFSGSYTITNVSGNIWVLAGTLANAVAAYTVSSAGLIALGGTLDRVRITTVNGTDTFDAGSINIMYE